MYILKVMIEFLGLIYVLKGNGIILKGDGGYNNRIFDVGSIWWFLKIVYIFFIIINRFIFKLIIRFILKLILFFILLLF